MRCPSPLRSDGVRDLLIKEEFASRDVSILVSAELLLESVTVLILLS
jgi:hypothetical protein